MLCFQLVYRFQDSLFGRPKADDANCRAWFAVENRGGYIFPCSLEFLLETIHVLQPRCRIFRVASILIVSGTTCEIGTCWMFVTRNGSIRNAIAIFIEITPPIAFELFKVFFPKHFAALHGDRRILKWFTHPLVHAHIEITQHKYRSLQLFGNIKSAP